MRDRLDPCPAFSRSPTGEWRHIDQATSARTRRSLVSRDPISPDQSSLQNRLLEGGAWMLPRPPPDLHGAAEAKKMPWWKG